jgi:hypothetical protein
MKKKRRQNSSDVLRSAGAAVSLAGHPEREFVIRAMEFQLASIDEANHSVAVRMTTETPCRAFDWDNGGLIDEVLAGDGGNFAEQIPLVDTHDLSTIRSTLGSVRDIRRDGDGWAGRAYFTIGDPDAESAWLKVKQKHVKDVSIRASRESIVIIPPGQTQAVNGRSYTAGDRPKRVVDRWTGKELSLVPIGEDPNTTTRQQNPAGHAPEKATDMLRKYLLMLGLPANATDAEAQAFHAKLKGNQLTRANALAAATPTMTLEDACRAEFDEMRALVATQAPAVGAAPAAGAAAPAAGNVTPPAGDTTRTQGPDRNEILRLERERVDTIRSIAPQGTPAELIRQAETEDWDVARAAREFLAATRNRTAPIGNDAPGAIIRDHDRDCTRGILGLALAMRSGVRGDNHIQATVQRARLQGRWEDAASQADRYIDMTLVDVCREALRLDGVNIPHRRSEVIRAAVSGGSLTNIFTTSYQARLMMAWDEEIDTTIAWVAEVEAPNFKANDDIDITANARLKRHARGGKADHADLSDSKETWRLSRYSRQLVIDEMDIIDDNFGKLAKASEEFGRSSRRIRPDLVYSLLLANPKLATDSKAVFHADHSNLGTGAGSVLSSAGLKAGTKAMASQVLGSGNDIQRLNIRPQFLIVPPDLEWTGLELITSTEIRDTTASTVRGTRNVVQDLKLTLISEGRIDATGVLDPTTETARTGSATNWFLAARPGRTIKVGYLSGSGRGPMIRSYNLSNGQWGVGIDVKMDIAAAIEDYRGLYKSAGA